MKKDSLRTTRSEHERQKYATRLASNITSDLESDQKVDIYERILDGPTGPQSRDGLELLIANVQEIFEYEGWRLPSLEGVNTQDELTPESSPQIAAIRKAAAEMKSQRMSREIFNQGTTRLIYNMLALSDYPEVLAFVLYRRLHTARHLRTTNPDKAVHLVAYCAVWLARLIVLLESKHRRQGAASKMARDPVQAAKGDAFKLWQDWRAQRARFENGADFARHVVVTFPAIKSTKTVERWVTNWRKEADAKRKKKASS